MSHIVIIDDVVSSLRKAPICLKSHETRKNRIFSQVGLKRQAPSSVPAVYFPIWQPISAKGEEETRAPEPRIRARTIFSCRVLTTPCMWQLLSFYLLPLKSAVVRRHPATPGAAGISGLVFETILVRQIYSLCFSARGIMAEAASSTSSCSEEPAPSRAVPFDPAAKPRKSILGKRKRYRSEFIKKVLLRFYMLKTFYTN